MYPGTLVILYQSAGVRKFWWAKTCTSGHVYIGCEPPNFQATDEEIMLAAVLPQMWDDLVYKSKNTDASLIVVKKKFTEVCYANMFNMSH